MSCNREYVLKSINKKFDEIIDLEWEELKTEKMKKLSQSQLIELVNHLFFFI
jgi:hypothetical protein